MTILLITFPAGVTDVEPVAPPWNGLLKSTSSHLLPGQSGRLSSKDSRCLLKATQHGGGCASLEPSSWHPAMGPSGRPKLMRLKDGLSGRQTVWILALHLSFTQQIFTESVLGTMLSAGGTEGWERQGTTNQ